jgi:hypothetical protein
MCTPCGVGNDYAVVVSSCSTSGTANVNVTVKLDQVTQAAFFGAELFHSDVVFLDGHSCPTRAPTQFGCPSHQCAFELDLLYDGAPSDIIWSLRRVLDDSSRVFLNSKSKQACIDPGFYDFMIADQGNDGLGTLYDGDYKLYLDNQLIRSKGTFSTTDGHFFKCSPPVVSAPKPKQVKPTCGSGETLVFVDFQNVAEDHKNVWSISTSDGYPVLEVFGAVDQYLCVPCGQTYFFRLNDVTGNGLGGGSFTVYKVPIVVVPNSPFTHSFFSVFTPDCLTYDNPTLMPSTNPSAAPSQLPTSANPTSAPTDFSCSVPLSKVEILVSYTGNPQDYTWRLYSLGDNSVDNFTQPAENKRWCALSGVYVLDFVSLLNDVASTYKVYHNDKLICDDKFVSNQACVIVASSTDAPSLAPSKTPSVSPSQAPTSSAGFDPTITGLDPVPTTCGGSQTGISVHTSRPKFSVTVVGLPSGKVYELSDSDRTKCVDNDSSFSFSFQTQYTGFSYFYRIGTDTKSGSSSSKGATVVYSPV